MDWITPQLAIGNYLDAENIINEVDAILCLKPECCDENNTEIDILALPFIDGAGNDKRLIKEAVEYINDIVSDGERILVHCHAGRSRSVCIVARYLMIFEGLTRYQAVAKIQAKREIYLSPGIEEILDVRL